MLRFTLTSPSIRGQSLIISRKPGGNGPPFVDMININVERESYV